MPVYTFTLSKRTHQADLYRALSAFLDHLPTYKTELTNITITQDAITIETDAEIDKEQLAHLSLE